MLKKISALLLSASLISAQFIAVRAEKPNETLLSLNTEQTTENLIDKSIVQEKELTTRFIVRLNDDTQSEQIVTLAEDTARSLNESDTDIDVSISEIIADKFCLVNLSNGVDGDAFVDAMTTTLADSIEYIQQDYDVQLATNNDVSLNYDTEYFNKNKTSVPVVSDVTSDTKNVVAVIDGDFNLNHDQLHNVFVDGWDILNETQLSSYEPSAVLGVDHGTLVSGIIHESSPEINIIPIKAFEHGVAYTSDILKAVEYVKGLNVSIVNCSWYSFYDNAALKEEIESAYNQLFVFAAGNTGEEENTLPTYPAKWTLDNVVSVGASDANGDTAYFSATGAEIDLCALGTDVSPYSTLNDDNYIPKQNGTSISAAYVTAAVSMIEEDSDIDSRKQALLESVADGECKNIQLPNYGLSLFSINDVSTQDTLAWKTANIVKMEASDHTTVLLLDDGTVWRKDEIIYDENYFNDFTKMAGLESIVDISANKFGALMALDAKGDLYVWGDGAELGMNSTARYPVAMKNPYVNGIDMIFCGSRSSFIQFKPDSSGHKKVYSTGDSSSNSNGYGRLCRDGAPLVFIEVPTIQDVTDIQAEDGILALVNGTVYAGGSACTNSSLNKFMEVPNIPKGKIVDITSAAAGQYYAVEDSGDIWAWNCNSNGHTPNTPSKLTSLTNVKRLFDAGYNEIIAEANDGKVYYSFNPAWNYEFTLLENIPSVKCADGYSGRQLILSKEGYLYIGKLPELDYMFYDGKLLSVTDPTGCSTLSGNSIQSYNLPSTVEVTYFDNRTNTEKTAEFEVTWDTGSYNPSKIGEQTIYGDINLHGLDNPDNLCAKIKIIVSQKPSIVSVDALDDVSVAYGTLSNKLTLPSRVYATLDNGTRQYLYITWNKSTYKPKQSGEQIIYGTFSQSSFTIANPKNLKAEVKVIVSTPPSIKEVLPISPITVPYDTSPEALDELLPTQAKVILDNDKTEILNISSWDKSEYKSDESGKYTLYGELQLIDGVANLQDKSATVTVIVKESLSDTNITQIEKQQISADQSVPFPKEDLSHSIGTPMTIAVPEKVTVHLDNGKTANLNVIWDAESYNPHQVGTQIITGEVVLKDNIVNLKSLKAELEITVVPTEYEVISSSPGKISIDVLAGTPKEKILEMVEPKVIDIEAVNKETNEIVYIYTGFTFSDEYAENTTFNPNQLGKQTLIGKFYDNFLEVSPACVEVEVNVVSSTIESIESTDVNTYQYVKFEDIENLPDKVTVNLENGMTADVDVHWTPNNYQRHIAGDQVVTGELINLPVGIVQPEQALTPPLIVHVQSLSYKITAVTPDENFFDNIDAGFELADLRAKIPVEGVKVDITSTVDGIDITTDYELDFILEEENNTGYLPEIEDIYDLKGTLVLSDNISNPENLMYEFKIHTMPVEIDEIEPVNVMVDYYTEFSDITLPNTVYIKLTNGQRKQINVDWGTGEGYDPDPADLTEDNPVKYNIDGVLCDIPQYINHYDTDIPKLTITLILPKVYTIKDIAPVRIPETGTKKINLGSSIADINDMLESHTVAVTLENLKGVQSTQDITFTLREEDNSNYDAMSEEEFELLAYLNLPDGIENPDNKQLVVSVRPTKYTIKSALAVRINGVLVETPFEEIGMPDKVTVNYTDTDTPTGEVPVTWNGSKYNPNKIGNQVVKGTFEPLPVYATNPNNRTASAIVNVVDPTVTILSAKEVTQSSVFSMLRRSVKRAMNQTESIDGFIEKKYEVELLHEDGTITIETISVFAEISEE